MTNNNQVRVQRRHNISQIQRPVSDSDEEWSVFWKTQNQDWRIKREISSERQAYLAKCCKIKSNHKKGSYPFKGIELERADIEWLLATHENGRGYVDWNDQSHRYSEGLDVRGADLSGMDLSHLPLAHLRGGLTGDEWSELTREELDEAARVNLKGANLEGAHLEGAILREACLEDADLSGAHLEKAELVRAQMKNVSLTKTHLEGANLIEVSLEDADLSHAHLEEATLTSAHLQGAILRGTNLERATLHEAHLEEANLSWARLEGANFTSAYLQRAYLRGAKLDRVNFNHTVLWDDNGISSFFTDVQWGSVNLAVIEWSKIEMLGDEHEARRKFYDLSTELKTKDRRLQEYENAVRANRQLAVALQAQGLNEDASRFAYHARALQQRQLWMQLAPWRRIQKMKRRVHLIQETSLWMRLRLLGRTVERNPTWKLWLRVRNRAYKWFKLWNSKIRQVVAFFLSFFFGLLAGYGYRPERALACYIIVIFSFALAYFTIGHQPFLPDALVLSLLSFHGRGFFPSINGEITLHSPLVLLAAIEAVIGLFIEMSFIATFTQRFFKG